MIAWAGSGQEIYYWDADTNTITQLTDNSIPDYAPSVYEGTIAWGGGQGGHELYYWDGDTITQLVDFGTNVSEPSLYDGTIAWSGTGICYWDGGSLEFENGPGPGPGEPIPEPSTMLLFTSGLIGLAGLRRKFKKR
jgi:hypothetical protein